MCRKGVPHFITPVACQNSTQLNSTRSLGLYFNPQLSLSPFVPHFHTRKSRPIWLRCLSHHLNPHSALRSSFVASALALALDMDANQQSQHDTGKSGPSKPRRKARARSKSLVELPAEMPAPQPSAPSPVLRKIPRPPNAFILYRSHKMRELKNQKDPSALVSTGLDKLDYQRNLSKVIGQLWREETESVKETFFAKAKQAAKEHSERYPEYRSKSSGTKKDPQEAESSILDSTPEKQQHTDFSPGDIRGPLSGSGSGSGRKRASLDGARSRASPYSASRHRRTSSTAPASPTARHSTGQAAQQHAPVLLYNTG